MVQPEDKVTEELVVWAYRLILGRDPVNQDVINLQMRHKNVAGLRSSLMASPEFQAVCRKALATEPTLPMFLLDTIAGPEAIRRAMPTLAAPTSQLCTRSQFEEPDYLKWCAAMRTKPALHRKQWEFIYILAVLQRFDLLRPGTRGVGFGTGREPLPSVMAARGVEVVATDLPAGIGDNWYNGPQHTTTADGLWRKDIIDRAKFDQRVTFQPCDMNNISENLVDFDFCWSSCCYEHLGNIQKGLDFLENSLNVLKPGGISVHTTEFNISSNTDTIEGGITALFRRSDFERAKVKLESLGHTVYPFNFFPGADPVDTYVDLPPYNRGNPHLKLALSKYVTTSFGIIIQKAL